MGSDDVLEGNDLVTQCPRGRIFPFDPVCGDAHERGLRLVHRPEIHSGGDTTDRGCLRSLESRAKKKRKIKITYLYSSLESVHKFDEGIVDIVGDVVR